MRASVAAAACVAGSYEGRPVTPSAEIAAIIKPTLDTAAAAERRPLGVTLATAPLVVGGGRAVGSAEAFAPLEELAGLLGGGGFGAAKELADAIKGFGFAPARPEADEGGIGGVRSRGEKGAHETHELH